MKSNFTMPAFPAYTAYMKLKAREAAQYTLRNVPPHVDRALRKLAKQKEQSLNQLVLDILERIVGGDSAREPVVHKDLDRLVGTWIEDPEFDQALTAQSQIDGDLWR